MTQSEIGLFLNYHWKAVNHLWWKLVISKNDWVMAPSQGKVKAFSKKTAIDLATKYNDLSKVDKVHKAQS